MHITAYLTTYDIFRQHLRKYVIQKLFVILHVMTQLRKYGDVGFNDETVPFRSTFGSVHPKMKVHY